MRLFSPLSPPPDCFLKLGQVNFAMADYQQALELSPQDSNLQRRVAWLYNEMGMQDFGERYAVVRVGPVPHPGTSEIFLNPGHLKKFLVLVARSFSLGSS